MKRMHENTAMGILNQTSLKSAIKAVHCQNILESSNKQTQIGISRVKIKLTLNLVDVFLKKHQYSPNQFRHAFAEMQYKHGLIQRGQSIRGWHLLASDSRSKIDECFRNLRTFGADSLNEFAEAVNVITDYRRRAHWIYDDGGFWNVPEKIRQDFSIGGKYGSNERGDCVVRAIAIALGLPYEEVWAYFKHKRSLEPTLAPKFGVNESEYEPFLIEYGWFRYRKLIPGLKVKDLIPRLKYSGWETPYIVVNSRHMTTVNSQGHIHDKWNTGNEFVVDLWIKKEKENQLEQILRFLTY